MTHPQQTTREVIEQLPLVRAESAITAAQSMLAHPTTSTTWEAPKRIWSASNRTATLLFWTEADARQAAAYSVAAGLEVGSIPVFGNPPKVEPAPSPEVLQALTDPENQPNQFGVVFGMHGPRMFFAIGNQSFDLAYEPDEPEEFEFMKRMLCSAFSTFTPDVKTAPAPSTAGEREVSLVEAFDNARKLVTPEILESFDALLQSTADHIPDAGKMVAALPVGELTLEQITRIYDRYGGDMVNCTRAIERELAAARSQP